MSFLGGFFDGTEWYGDGLRCVPGIDCFVVCIILYLYLVLLTAVEELLGCSRVFVEDRWVALWRGLCLLLLVWREE